MVTLGLVDFLACDMKLPPIRAEFIPEGRLPQLGDRESWLQGNCSEILAIVAKNRPGSVWLWPFLCRLAKRALGPRGKAGPRSSGRWSEGGRARPGLAGSQVRARHRRSLW